MSKKQKEDINKMPGLLFVEYIIMYSQKDKKTKEAFRIWRPFVTKKGPKMFTVRRSYFADF